MRIGMRAAARLTLSAWVALSGLGLAAASAATPAEKALPASTVAFLKVNNAAAFREALSSSQIGRLVADPEMKPLKEDFTSKLEDASTKLKDKLGVTLRELAELPQGPITIALVAKAEAKVPVALLITADAAKNDSKMKEVMTKATKQAEEAGAKVNTEDFKGLKLTVIQYPKPGDDAPEVPLVWATAGGVYHISSDVDALKDFITHADGRDDSLANSDTYEAVVKKLGAESQFTWFFDLEKGLKLILEAGSKAGGGGNAQQAEAILQLTGIKGLKAVGGSYALNVGGYDSLSKTYFYAPGPPQGVLKAFSTPKVNLRPQPWVPATVASYQSVSWDLDGAYNAINDLANQFQPGILQVLQQQLAGPNGGDPIDFQKDIFGPLGDRITVISDFKKPIKDDSQRIVFAVALEDAKAFGGTLGKVINLAGGQPKKREFQGTTIYDFTLPEMPNNNGANNPFKGPISVAVAKDTLFVATEPGLLEQVLRGGGPSLADSPEFAASLKGIPEATSTLTYTRPEESARQSYDMIKSGQFEKAISGAAMAGGPDVAKLSKVIDKDKLPPFEVFAKYLTQGGGFGVQEEDGALFTGYSLRKSNP